MRRYLFLVLLLFPVISCTSEKRRSLSGVWTTKRPADMKIRVLDERQIEAEFFVRADLRYQRMEGGMAYMEAIDGKPIRGWALAGDGKPCTVSMPRGAGVLTLPASVALLPESTLMTRVNQTGDAKQWIQTSGCEYFAKMMFETSADKTPRIYELSTAGTLRVKALYRPLGTDQWEVFVEVPNGKATEQLVLAKLRETGPAMVVAGNGTYLPEDVRYERLASSR